MKEKLFYQTIFAGIFLWFLIHNTAYLLEQKSQTKEFIQPHLKYLLKEELINEIKEEQKEEEQEAERNPKVLVPIVIYGPNNQYQGFRESIMIAKILNRKVGRSSNKLIVGNIFRSRFLHFSNIILQLEHI